MYWEIIYPFKFNDPNAFNNLINKNKNRHSFYGGREKFKIKYKFLKEIRRLCTKNKTILIFYECSSGFRETYGGYI